MIPETGQLDWDDLDRCLNQHRNQGPGHRRRLQRPGDDQRHSREPSPWPTRPMRWPSSTRFTSPLTSSSTCESCGLRLPGLLGLQVPRAACRRALRQARVAANPRRHQAAAGPGHRARADGDGHAESRGNRGRRGGRRVPGGPGWRRAESRLRAADARGGHDPPPAAGGRLPCPARTGLGTLRAALGRPRRASLASGSSGRRPQRHERRPFP